MELRWNDDYDWQGGNAWEKNHALVLLGPPQIPDGQPRASTVTNRRLTLSTTIRPRYVR
jgi:hypothetical protein